MEDHKLFLSLLKPNFFLPFYMPAAERYAHKKIALDMGMPNEKILMPNQN
jgi:mRNA degradation ribonuclease J1/J2